MTPFMDWNVQKLKDLAKREAGPFIGMTFASLLLCFLIAALIEPYKFASTGVTGIALITNYTWGMSPVWVLTIVNALDKDTLGRAAAGVRSRTVLVDAGPKIDPAVTVSIGHYLPLRVCDYQEQGKLCVQALLEQKKTIKRLGCIGGPKEALQSRARVAGALSALRALTKIETRILWSDFTRRGGEESLEAFMDWHPDALFCANDLMALGALDVLEAAGRKIPVGGIDMIPSAVFSVRNGGMAATVGVNGSDVVLGLLHAVDDYLSFGLIEPDFLARNHVVTSWSLGAQKRRRRFL